MSPKIFCGSFYPFFDLQNNLRFKSEPQITFRPSTALSNSAKARTDGLRPADSLNVFNIPFSLKAFSNLLAVDSGIPACAMKSAELKMGRLNMKSIARIE